MIDPSIALEVAWVAGLFEGEGSFTVATKRENGRASPVLSVYISDVDDIERVQRLFGGGVSGPYKNPKRPNHKAMYSWSVANWDDFERIGYILLPFLGRRRTARFEEVMAKKPRDRWRRPNTDLCAEEPWPSLAGYMRHRKRGETACEVCLESYRLYSAAKRESAKARGVKVRTPRIATACPDKVVPSQAGANRHRYLGEPVCDICKESAALYLRLYRQRKRISEIND